MAYEIVYYHQLAYDVNDAGITLPVIIAANGLTEAVTAAIDTGSTLCVFQREVAESLGLTVEDGIEDYVSAMGTIIRVYGHEATVTVGDLALDLLSTFLTTRASRAICWAGRDFCNDCASASMTMKGSST